MIEVDYIDDMPVWMRVTGNPNWPYDIKNSPQKHAHMTYSPELIAQVADLRKQGLSFLKIAKLLGCSRERIRNICEKRLEEK